MSNEYIEKLEKITQELSAHSRMDLFNMIGEFLYKPYGLPSDRAKGWDEADSKIRELQRYMLRKLQKLSDESTFEFRRI